MERETIIYRGEKYHRYPASKRRQLRVYYWKHPDWDYAPVALHRQIWIDNHGTIQKGYVIHHKDSNPLNNSLSNLECIQESIHMSNHAKEPKNIEKAKINLQKFAIPKAKEWHSSEEGLKWHKEHVKVSLAKIHYKEYECTWCKKKYLSKKTNTTFCSARCYEKHRWPIRKAKRESLQSKDFSIS